MWRKVGCVWWGGVTAEPDTVIVGRCASSLRNHAITVGPECSFHCCCGGLFGFLQVGGGVGGFVEGG